MEPILFRIALCVGDVFAGNGFEFAADDVGGETCAEEAAVEGSELAIIDLLYCIGAAIGAQLTFDSLPDDGGLVRVPGGFFKGGFETFWMRSSSAVRRMRAFFISETEWARRMRILMAASYRADSVSIWRGLGNMGEA